MTRLNFLSITFGGERLLLVVVCGVLLDKLGFCQELLGFVDWAVAVA